MGVTRTTAKPPAQFSPTVMFKPTTDSDNKVHSLMYSLYQDVAETMDTERSRQTRIGISEIGNPCDKCVARKLGEDQVKDPNWRAQVGTFIHAGLEQHMTEKYVKDAWGASPMEVHGSPAPTDERPHYSLEKRVRPWERDVLGKPFVLEGSTDVFVQGASFGLVGDWKTQGTEKILKKTSKGDIGATYTVQMQTYGLGWEKAGHLVTHVALLALPRDNELRASAFVLMRYDRDVAIQALARLDRMLDAYELIERAFPGEGWPRLVDSQQTASGCLDCPRYNRRDREDAFSWIS